jgi:hypothetical protein
VSPGATAVVVAATCAAAFVVSQIALRGRERSVFDLGRPARRRALAFFALITVATSAAAWAFTTGHTALWVGLLVSPVIAGEGLALLWTLRRRRRRD